MKQLASNYYIYRFIVHFVNSAEFNKDNSATKQFYQHWKINHILSSWFKMIMSILDFRKEILFDLF